MAQQAQSVHLTDEKPTNDGIEDIEDKGLDTSQAVVVTEEDDRRIRRKTDRYILILLIWVYFLQIYDKTVFGLGNTFGLTTDLKLKGADYSLASSMTSIATLCWQPFSAYIIVRFPSRYIMTICVFGWGTAAACMCAVTNSGGLFATRFLLGAFEAANIPLFSMLTAQWYRRSEQPLRYCSWFVMNSTATIVGAIIAYGFAHTNSSFKPWQSLYLSAGIITVLTAPIVWWRLDSDVAHARFWRDDYERDQAIERLRANKTGVGNYVFKWAQVGEMFMDPKTYLFAIGCCIPNIANHVSNTFGPTLIKGFGFDTKTAVLLNIPFGAVQAIGIVGACYGAQRFKIKSVMAIILSLLGLSGAVMMYCANTTDKINRNLALTGYYFLAFCFGIPTVTGAWMIANVAGSTKRSTMLSFMNCATATGQLTGPLLFKSTDAPHYLPGIRSVMIAQSLLIVGLMAQVVNLYFLNKRRRAQRAAAGIEEVHDTSMDKKFTAAAPKAALAPGAIANEDETDWQNINFVYVY